MYYEELGHYEPEVDEAEIVETGLGELGGVPQFPSL